MLLWPNERGEPLHILIDINAQRIEVEARSPDDIRVPLGQGRILGGLADQRRCNCSRLRGSVDLEAPVVIGVLVWQQAEPRRRSGSAW
jgi:hypothetical protein